jgi:hypothetical protein
MDLSSADLIAPIVALCSAVVAVASVVVTVAEGRAARRNTEFLAHRDQWWNRWTWIAEQLASNDPAAGRAAALLGEALRTRPWTTADDLWMADAIDAGALDEPDDEHEGEVDDLECDGRTVRTAVPHR